MENTVVKNVITLQTLKSWNLADSVLISYPSCNMFKYFYAKLSVIVHICHVCLSLYFYVISFCHCAYLSCLPVIVPICHVCLSLYLSVMSVCHCAYLSVNFSYMSCLSAMTDQHIQTQQTVSWNINIFSVYLLN